MSPAAPVHVVPLYPTGRDHSASPTCWCGPVQTFRDLATGGPVYRHRMPVDPPPERCRDPRAHAPDHRLYRSGDRPPVAHCPRCERDFATAVAR